MSSAVAEWLFAVAMTLCQLALYWAVSPRRIGIVSSIHPGPLESELFLAIHNLEPERISGPFRVELHAEAPGGFLTGVARCYVGTPHDREGLSVTRRNARHMTVSVREMRAAKTWLVVLPCDGATRIVRGTVQGPRRSLAASIGIAGSQSDVFPRWQAPDFVFRFVSGHMTRAGRSTRATLSAWRTLLPLLGTAVAIYGFLVASIGHHVNLGAPVEWLVPAGVVFGVAVLFLLIRPHWPIVAQGYLEPWLVPVDPPDGVKATEANSAAGPGEH